MKKEEKTRLTKEKILKAAIEEFGRNGYSGGSLNAVCASGINKGLIYHNFKDKDDLYLACVKKSLDDMAEGIEEEMKDPSVSYPAARARFFESHDMEARIFLEAVVNPPEKLEDEIEELRKPVDEINRREFDRILSRHTLRKNISRETAYRWMRSMQNAYNMLFRQEDSGDGDFAKHLERHEKGAAEFVDLMLFGIAEQEEK
ncbi:MAG: TetR/AcrR family transcriptional regulator [Anaerovoracaceae bacterium]|jgi:TetR/AcrR family transcriptional regulator